MSGSCLTPRTTVRTYPQAPCPPAMSGSTDCQMYDEYTPCGDCPDYPNGYPTGKCLVVNVNGKCWMAVSMEGNNTSNPYNFIGNTDESEPWVVVKPCDMLKWLIKDGTGDFLTEDQINALISNFLTEGQINALISNFLTEGQINALISNFLTEDQINSLISNFLTEGQINALISNFLTEDQINALIDAQKLCKLGVVVPDSGTKIAVCSDGKEGLAEFSDFLDKACFTFPTLPADACNIKSLVEGTDSNGCKKAFSYSTSDLCIGLMTPWGINQAPIGPIIMPDIGGGAASSADVDHYTEDLLSDHAVIDPIVGGTTIDAALLNNTLIAKSNEPVVLTCTTRLNFNIQINNVVFDLLQNGQKEAALVITYNDGSGETIGATSSVTWPPVKFTNSSTESQTSENRTFPPGSYEFKAYLLGANGLVDVTNVLLIGNGPVSGTILIDICKAV